MLELREERVTRYPRARCRTGVKTRRELIRGRRAGCLERKTWSGWPVASRDFPRGYSGKMRQWLPETGRIVFMNCALAGEHCARCRNSVPTAASLFRSRFCNGEVMFIRYLSIMEDTARYGGENFKHPARSTVGPYWSLPGARNPRDQKFAGSASNGLSGLYDEHRRLPFGGLRLFNSPEKHLQSARSSATRPRPRARMGKTWVFYNKYPADKRCTQSRRTAGGECSFIFPRHVEFMVDEWLFEFLPGNSSLIFRIILPSTFRPVAAVRGVRDSTIFRCFTTEISRRTLRACSNVLTCKQCICTRH